MHFPYLFNRLDDAQKSFWLALLLSNPVIQAGFPSMAKAITNFNGWVGDGWVGAIGTELTVHEALFRLLAFFTQIPSGEEIRFNLKRLIGSAKG